MFSESARTARVDEEPQVASAIKVKLKPLSARWRRVSKVALAGLVGFVAVFGAGLLWRPAAAVRLEPRRGFIAAVAASQVPAAAASLLTDGRATVVLKASDIADIAAAVIDRGDPSAPDFLVAPCRRKIPAWVKSLLACEVSPEGITVYVACKKGVTLYATLSLSPVRRDDGTLAFNLSSARVGLLPIPRRFLRRHPDSLVIDPRPAGFTIEKVECGSGRMTLDLKKKKGGRHVQEPA